MSYSHPVRASGAASLNNLRSRQSLDNWENFTEDLQASLRSNMPRTNGYAKATVLAFRFDNDDMNVRPLTEELGRAFKRHYNINFIDYVISTSENGQTLSSTTVTTNVRRRIRDFITQMESTVEDQKHLLVYYFSCHLDWNRPEQETGLSFA